ncbi:MAG: T9SS type A sorting domain-containing protein [Candidatus Kapaibacterium sp.]
MNHTKRCIAARFISLLTFGFLLLAATAGAQQFQTTFGAANFEDGRGGVKPLVAGNGYISVGYTNSFGPNDDVYIVESNLTGGCIWAMRYDFANSNERGYDIQETTTGDFIVTGWTDAPGTQELFILKVNNQGQCLCATTFGPGAAGTNSLGWDIMEDANSGLYVAAGWVTNANGLRDGLIAAVDPNCNRICATTYAPAFPTPDLDDYFHGIWQSPSNGNYILCGGTTSFGSANQAWILEIAPVNTACNSPILWSQHVGGPIGNEEFNSVIELTIGAQAGNIVAVGSTTDPAVAPSDFYVAKFNGGGGIILPDITGGGVVTADEMYQVRELASSNLLLTGNMNPGPFGGQDAYAVEMTNVWNCPVGKVWSMAYGGTGNDLLYSGSEDPNNCVPGYILCGLTASPNLIGPDPQQMYLLKTDVVGSTSSVCPEIRPADRCTAPNFPSLQARFFPRVQPWGVNWPINCNPACAGFVICLMQCRPPGCSRQHPLINGDLYPWSDHSAAPSIHGGTAPGTLTGIPQDNVADAPAGAATASVANMYPNPVPAGSSFQLKYMLASGRDVSVVISDVSGNIVYTEKGETNSGSGSLTVSTKGWAVGSYLIKMDLGTETQTKRIVVIDK